MKKEAEGSAVAPKTEVGGGWTTTLCCVLRRLDEREGVYAYITLTSPFARTFLSVPFYIFYRSLSFRARSRDFPLASLVLSSLPCPRLFLRLSSRSPFASLSFSRPRVLLLRPSSHLSSRVPLRCSPSAPCFVAPSSSRIQFLSSSVLGVPSVLGPDGPIVPRSRLTGLLMAHRIEREVDPCCYAATAAEIHERSERERGSRAETNGRRATAMIIIRADRITSAARRRRGRVFRCCCSITFFLLPPPSPSLSPIPL